ncbi:disulfide bond formation protein B [Rhizobium sp. KVB221]|uniref:Disulfide bond formation protein B n=1 Tax=Rhizobium setariae TaxID=2801340 RepID=A0A936YWJ3_9HYPH|nr:disulfide bond formation protein B [Rhizobium setariae]MBL0374700.1 disulfide bond formation protein B [Rhizobium setariae]
MTATRPHLFASILLLVGMIVVIFSALGFEHLGGYVPCMLCLLQRDPYYVGIPVAVLAVLSSLFGLPSKVTRVLLGIAAILMLVGAGLGVYHAGVEWGFWEGPATCSTSVNAVTKNAGSLLDDINTQHGPSCTDATLRVLGLSFAGWNVIVSLVLAAIGFRGAAKRA